MLLVTFFLNQAICPNHHIQIQTGIYPDNWKKSNIVPDIVYKELGLESLEKNRGVAECAFCFSFVFFSIQQISRTWNNVRGQTYAIIVS